MNKKFDIIAKTLFGLEEILAQELKALGAENIQILRRAVKYKGDEALLYKSNLHLRTAIKILKPITTFTILNEDQLYTRIKQMSWGAFINTHQTFAIDAVVNGKVITHSKFAALKAKDAIVDQFREKTGERPSIDTENPNLRINLHISDRTCDVSIDSSGDPLGRRGYRLIQTEAPITETLAAGIILLSGWDKKSDFIDPMCGSGTFPIEAAMIAHNIAPGRIRNFAFENWNDFDAPLWKSIKKEAEDQIKPVSVNIIGRDMDAKAIEISKKNAKEAKVEDLIDFEKADFMESTCEGEKALVIMNPPYGERLDMDEIINFYKEIGTRLKHHYANCEAWIISSNFEALKQVGLKTSKKIPLFNGALECKLQKYELYKGSKRV